MSKPPPAPKEIAEAWAGRVAEVLRENGELRAVVAAQREALVFYADEATYEEGTEPHPTRFATGVVPIEADRGERARAALDAEGVSEPGPAQDSLEAVAPSIASPGSLTFLAESALREITRWGGAFDDATTLLAIRNYARMVLRTLDAASEEMSEPGIGDVFPSVHRGEAPKYSREVSTPGSLTSPVDTAPRGYVEHGPGGPQAVYYAETPDDFLVHGDVASPADTAPGAKP